MVRRTPHLALGTRRAHEPVQPGASLLEAPPPHPPAGLAHPHGRHRGPRGHRTRRPHPTKSPTPAPPRRLIERGARPTPTPPVRAPPSERHRPAAAPARARWGG